MGHLRENHAVERLQNPQLIPEIFYPLAPGMKIFRLRIVDRFCKPALPALIDFRDRAANLLPSRVLQRPFQKARFHTFQLRDRLFLPAGKRGRKTFPLQRQ